MNKRELLQQRATLAQEAQQLLAALNTETATTDDIARASEIDAAIDDIDKQILAHDDALAKVKTRMASEPRVAVIRDNAEDRPFTSFGEFLIAVKNVNPSSGYIDPRLRKYASGANETIGSEGGFLVDKQMANEVYEGIFQTSILLPKCFNVPIGDGFNGVKINSIDETSRANGSRYGGVRAYWAAEAATVTATQPKFKRVELELKKLMAIFYATSELLADATALQGIVSQVVPAEIGFGLDEAIYNGTGAGTPLGMMNSGALVTITKEGSQTAATVNWANVSKMFGRLPAASQNRAEWFLNSEVYAQLLLLTSAASSAATPMFVPPGRVADAPLGTLYGRRINILEQCAALGTTGDIMVADMSQYVVATKGVVNQASSMHVRFLYDEEVFRFTYRIDGTPRWTSAITPYKGSATLSPFVVVETRS